MDTLKDLRKSCKERNIPIISTPTERFLHKLLLAYKPDIVLELGGAVGYSGISMAKKLQRRGGTIYSFEISYPAYRESLQHANTDQIFNLISYPYNCLHVALEKLLPKKKVDFVFIDAQKAQYGAYLAKIENIIHDKTVIIIDDVIKYHHKLSLLYRYLSKKQIKCIGTTKGGRNKYTGNGESHTSHSQKNYEIIKLDLDDGIMIINNYRKILP